MTFKSIDEYETYIEQINEEHWEKLAMAADKKEQFNEMMRIQNEEMEQDLIDNPHGPQTEVERGGPYLATDPGAKEVLHKHRKEVKVVECILETDEYLGYLLGCAVISRLEGNWLLSGFYQGKYDKFVSDNTPK